MSKEVPEQNLDTSKEITASEEPELPPFTLQNVLLDIKSGILALINDPYAVRFVVPILVPLTSILCKIIITYVNYTEIDFSTYMQQIELINNGELDYANIAGDSGPIVYPAGFVQIYQFLYLVTDGGKNLHEGQMIFTYLLTLTNLLICIAYTSADSIAPWAFYMLLGSKRLFSIYVLRLFNDCFTTFAIICVVVLLQQSSYWATSMPTLSYILALVATDLYSLLISIKMNALLYLPGFLIITYFLCRENPFKFALLLLVFPFVQITTAWKFLLPLFSDEDAVNIRWNYINNAFNFGRKFLYKWTVNWRFIDESTFLLDEFANVLLLGNLTVLLLFIFNRFLLPIVTGKLLSQLIKDAFKFKSTVSEKNVFLSSENGPRFILLIMSITNLVGVVFARSLHYQFLSWYCWQLPYLLFATGWPIFVTLPLWIAHEYSWNAYPSTPISSGLLVSILVLVLVRLFQRQSLWKI